MNDDCALIPPGKETDKQARAMARGLGGLVILYKVRLKVFICLGYLINFIDCWSNG